MYQTIKNKIKSKFAKRSKERGGITFSDSNLFNVGTKFKYAITDNKIFIIKDDTFEQIAPSLGIDSNEETNIFNGTVSKKGIDEIPLIDIRRKSANNTFGEADTLIVDIYDDYVVVTGYDDKTKDDAENNSSKRSSRSIIQKLGDKLLNSKVVNLNEKKLEKKFEVRFAKKHLQASGEQISFADFDSLFNTSTSSNLSESLPTYLKQAFEQIEIPLKVASFFSGAGLLDYGFKKAGFEIVFALEKDKAASQTYLQNFGDHIICGDIRHFNKSIVRGIPVFIGGPPCQGFSNSNRHTNFLENENNALVSEYIKVIKSSPDVKFFVLENVPQILTAGDGKFKNEIIEELNDFDISYGVLNSVDFGCAQSRRRAFFIGSKKELGLGKLELPKPTHSKENYVTVGEALSDIPEDAPNQKDFTKPKEDTLKKMSFIEQGQNWEAIPDEYRTERMSSGRTHSSVYRRLKEDEPSITIANPRKSNILHPWLNRILSVRECARLFGLPDDFVFFGTLSDKQQQPANGVPVQLGGAVARVILWGIQQFNIRIGAAKPVLV